MTAQRGQNIVCPTCGKRWSLPPGPAPVDWTICPACGSRVPIVANLRPGPVARPADPAPPPVGPPAPPPIAVPAAVPTLPLSSPPAFAGPSPFIVSSPPVRPPGISPGGPPPVPVLPPVPAPPPFHIPTAPPPYVVTTQPAPNVAPVAADQKDDRAQPDVDAARVDALPASGGALLKWLLICSLAAISIAAMVLVVVLLIRSNPGSEVKWERLHAAEIRQDIAAAEAAIVQNHPEVAIERYDDIDQLVGMRALIDPRLLAEVERARARREALVEQGISAGVRPAGPPAATAPASRPSEIAGASPSHPRTAVAPPPPPLSDIQLFAPPVKSAHHAPVREAPLADASGITDARIGESIEKAVGFLLSQLSSGVHDDNDEYHDGEQILATYALLQAGQSVSDDRLDVQGPTMSRLITQMKDMDLQGRLSTYTRGLRATALALLNRPEDHAALQADVDYLVSASTDGSFTYGKPRRLEESGISSPPRESRGGRNGAASGFDAGSPVYDNSNSQYGLLGVWSGAEAGCIVSSHFWEEVQDHWTTTQMPEGQWGYDRLASEPRLSMTFAGVASLLVTNDYLGAMQHGNDVGRPPYDSALQKGLDWLATGDNCLPTMHEMYRGYTLYGLERVGLASGYKYFGNHEWYPELAKEAVSEQYANGSWGTLIETSYELLFLARGRHPILMNKLLFGGAWDNRPRDVANLAGFTSAEIELPLNWQVVPVTRPWRDWTDSPILYIASHKAPSITSDQIANIASFVRAGGMVLTQADGGSAEFDKFATALGKQLFPEYAWQNLPADHPLYNSFYPLKPSSILAPRIITNGSRILMIHLPQDISRFWQLRQQSEQPWAHQFGVNLYIYAAGKSDLQNRLSTTVLPSPPRLPDDVFRVALINNGPDSDPEPGAWDRFSNWFYEQTSLGLKPEPRRVADLNVSETPLAHLTGTAVFTMTPDDIAAIAKYVNDGGVLLVDPCGQGDAFADSAHDMLARAFPSATLGPMPLSHPALSKTTDFGMLDLAYPQLRPFARQKFTRETARPQILTSGKGAVIYLPLDMTSGLLGTNTWGIAGYDPDYAQRLARNIILWVWAGAPQSPALDGP